MGGTIDAEAYQETPQDIVQLKESVIPDVLDELGLRDKCDVQAHGSGDSKYFQAGYADILAKRIEQQPQNKVIVTHGTDRLPEFARDLQVALKDSDKVVLVTGAMIPLMNEIVGYGKSDGYGNLSFAFEQVEKLESGVHIAFHDKIFDPARTKKDFEAKKFVELDKPIDGFGR